VAAKQKLRLGTMSSALALLLCSAFVFYLLKYDRRQSNKVSGALWVPTIWIFSIATKSLASWFGAGGEDIESGSPLDRIFVSGLLCLGLFIFARRKVAWLPVIKKNTWLALLIAYMLISILWSDIPFISFKRWTRELTAIVMALVVLTESAPRQAMESLFRRTVYILIPFSILLIKYFPQYGIEYGWSGEVAWAGVTLQKNGLGRLCLISAFFLVWTLFRRWKGREIGVPKLQTLAEVILLVLTVWLLKGPSSWAASATGFVALSTGLATFASLLWMKKHRIDLGVKGWMTITACIIALGIIQPLIGGSTVGGFASSLGRNETLTGRTDIWALLLPAVMRNPILGTGFGGFWTSMTTAKIGVNEAHNGYLGVCLGLGVFGLLLTIFFLLSFCRNAARALAHDFDWASLCICFLLMAAVHNISESSFDSFTKHMMAILLFLAVTFPTAVKRRSARAQSVERKAVNSVIEFGRSSPL
jgi:exopolysaccharide production protein ExoQ